MIRLQPTMQNLTDFLLEFESRTKPHPASRHLRVWKGRVLFEVSIFGNSIRLSYIEAMRLSQGDGTAALKWFIKLSRTHKVTVKGSIRRMGKEGLSRLQLRQWYVKHGFTHEQGNIVYQGK